MTPTALRPWLGTIARLVLGGIWIWAALAKIHDPRGFVQDVRAYDFTTEGLAKGIGYTVPVLEFAVGVLLILGLATRGAAIVSSLLFLVFLVGLSEAAIRGIKLNCGCFGGGGLTTGSTHYTLEILRDVVLLAVAVFLVLYPLTKVSIEAYLGRNDYVEPPSAKRMRTEQGARKYNAMVEARRKEARDRGLYVNVLVFIVVALAVVIGFGVQSNRAKISGDLTATNATVANGVVYGKVAPATMDVFEDFQCPHCLELEESTQSWLDSQVKADIVQVRFHSMSFLDSSSSGNRYSSRAANAALCASDLGVDQFVAYHNVLFTAAVQPAEGSKGRTNTDLINYGKQAGFTAAQVTTFTTCVNSEQHKALVQAITDNASKRGVNGTPTVWVNGKTVSNPTLASLQAAVAAARAKSTIVPSPSPTPTPTPTVSPSSSARSSSKVTASPSKKVTATPKATSTKK